MSFTRTTLALTALLLAAVGMAKPTITDVRANKVGDGVEIKVIGQELAKPKELRVNGGKVFFLEFGANMAGTGKRFAVGHAGVSTVRLAWYKSNPPTIRVALYLRPTDTVKVAADPQGWVARVNVVEKPAEPKPEETYAVTEAVPAQPDIAPPFKPYDWSQRDPGPMEPPIQWGRVHNNANYETAEQVAEAFGPTAAYAASAAMVSLDFVDTDIVQIIKALSIQAGVNIVTAPGLEGKMSVSLEAVTVEEALDFITSLSDLRYAKVRETYVVSSMDKFAAVMRAVTKGQEQAETRIVPIYSGEGAQIRQAVMKAYPADSAKGGFDVVLPTEAQREAAPAAPATPPPAEGATAAESTSSTPATSGDTGTAVSKSISELYILLVGPPMLLDEVEKLVKIVDESICNAYGIEIPDESNLVRESYRVRSASLDAAALIDTVTRLKGTLYRNVELYSSPSGSDQQTIVMVGRSTEVERVLDMLAEFDVSGENIYVYNVKYLDPRPLREQVVAQVPGLSATIPPATATNSRLYQPGVSTSDLAENPAGGATQGNEGPAAPDVSVTGAIAQDNGFLQPFQDLEKTSVPMKLVLRGSDEQIEEALSYLAMIDTAPRQIALELRVMELSKEDATRVGIDWSIFTGGVVRALRFNNTLGDTSATPGTISGEFADKADGSNGADVLATLDSIDDGRRYIARPNLLAVDGRETELFVGDVVRYIESVQSSQNGVTITTGEVRVGVRFAVLARVADEDRISLDLRPVVSLLQGFTPVPGGGNLPQTSERAIQSTMQIRSGETIALGGLIQESDRRVHSGIPILKDLPIIGALFGRTEHRKQRSEIVFFLTARIVGEEDRGNSASPALNAELNPGRPDADAIQAAKDAKKEN